MRNMVVLAAGAAAFLANPDPARAETGANPDTILFGQAAVLQGPAPALGLGMKAGLEAAFDEIFDIGGLTMTFGQNDNEGLGKVFMTVIQPDGSFKAVDRLIRMSAN